MRQNKSKKNNANCQWKEYPHKSRIFAFLWNRRTDTYFIPIWYGTSCFEIDIQKGNHEEIFRKLQADEMDIVINDQRRAFSNEYENFELVKAYGYIEINRKNHISSLEIVLPEDLKKLPCILVAANG